MRKKKNAKLIELMSACKKIDDISMVSKKEILDYASHVVYKQRRGNKKLINTIYQISEEINDREKASLCGLLYEPNISESDRWLMCENLFQAIVENEGIGYLPDSFSGLLIEDALVLWANIANQLSSNNHIKTAIQSAINFIGDTLYFPEAGGPLFALAKKSSQHYSQKFSDIIFQSIDFWIDDVGIFSVIDICYSITQFLTKNELLKLLSAISELDDRDKLKCCLAILPYVSKLKDPRSYAMIEFTNEIESLFWKLYVTKDKPKIFVNNKIIRYIFKNCKFGHTAIESIIWLLIYGHLPPKDKFTIVLKMESAILQYMGPLEKARVYLEATLLNIGNPKSMCKRGIGELFSSEYGNKYLFLNSRLPLLRNVVGDDFLEECILENIMNCTRQETWRIFTVCHSFFKNRSNENIHSAIELALRWWK